MNSNLPVFLLCCRPPGVQEGGGADEPGPDQETDGAEPVRGGAGQDQRHGGRAAGGAEGQAAGVHPAGHAVHLQRPLHRRPAAHAHRAGESSLFSRQSCACSVSFGVSDHNFMIGNLNAQLVIDLQQLCFLESVVVMHPPLDVRLKLTFPLSPPLRKD